nr:hypothetical protein GCM10017745_65490 [Saccharothrix mutabilis subsp. capreolus]
MDLGKETRRGRIAAGQVGGFRWRAVGRAMACAEHRERREDPDTLIGGPARGWLERGVGGPVAAA